jgi:hypothetical protein
MTYFEVSAGANHSLALRSDNACIAWGDNSHGQCNVPTLPFGSTFLDIAAGGTHTLARLTSVATIAWGDNSMGQCNVPVLPAGVSYGQVAAGQRHSAGRRSDGLLDAWGDNAVGQCDVPPLPAGLTWVEVACGGKHTLARRSDGAVFAWGNNLHGQCNVPALPAGVVYVGIAGGSNHSVARRSDGTVIAWGNNALGQCDVPALPAGQGYSAIAAGTGFVVACSGAVSSYTTFATGCAGTRPATRLVPEQTPRIRLKFTVRLFDLPMNVALMMTGWSTTTSPFGPLPLDLGALGMPGCTGYVSPDLVDFVTGTGNQATWRLRIPNDAAFIGAQFHQQALVFDQGANPLGAVESDATTVVVGS